MFQMLWGCPWRQCDTFPFYVPLIGDSGAWSFWSLCFFHKNFNLAQNFWMLSACAFIFHILCGKTFLKYKKQKCYDFLLAWSLTFFFKKNILGYNTWMLKGFHISLVYFLWKDLSFGTKMFGLMCTNSPTHEQSCYYIPSKNELWGDNQFLYDYSNSTTAKDRMTNEEKRALDRANSYIYQEIRQAAEAHRQVLSRILSSNEN